MENYEERTLKDGIYDISNLDFLVISNRYHFHDLKLGKVPQQLSDFMIKYPNYSIGYEYNAPDILFLSDKPKKFTGTIYGGDFGYEVAVIIQDCPKAILIVAENEDC